MKNPPSFQLVRSQVNLGLTDVRLSKLNEEYDWPT